MFMCPTNKGPKDPRLTPAVEDLARMGCDRVLVLVAEKDDEHLYEAGKKYAENLIKSGWKGTVAELMENKGKEHIFHLYDPLDPEAVAIRQRISSFIHHHHPDNKHGNTDVLPCLNGF